MLGLTSMFGAKPAEAPPNCLNPLWRFDLGTHPLALTCAADGRWLGVGTVDGELMICDAHTGMLSMRCTAHAQGLLSAAFGGDGLIASGGQDGMLRFWRVEASAEANALLTEHKLGVCGVEHVAWTPDQQHCIAAAGKTVALFGTDGSERWRIQHTTPVRALAFNPAGNRLALSGSGGASIIHTRDGTLDRQLAHKSPLLSLAWGPYGRVLASGTADNTVHFWRLPGSDSQMSGFEGPPFRPMALAWNGTTLATGGDQAVALWKFSGSGPEGKAPQMLEAHIGIVTHLAFDSAGKWLASSARDCSVILRAVAQNFAVKGVAILNGEATGLLWNPGAALLHTIDASGCVRGFGVAA